MKNLRYVIAGELLAGALCFPAMPVSADPKENTEYLGWHKGWEKNHHGSAKGHDKKWKDCDHHEAVYRERDRHGDHYYSKDFHHHYPGDPRRMEIRQDVQDVRAARNEVLHDRGQLQKNVEELKKRSSRAASGYS